MRAACDWAAPQNTAPNGVTRFRVTDSYQCQDDGFLRGTIAVSSMNVPLAISAPHGDGPNGAELSPVFLALQVSDPSKPVLRESVFLLCSHVQSGSGNRGSESGAVTARWGSLASDLQPSSSVHRHGGASTAGATLQPMAPRHTHARSLWAGGSGAGTQGRSLSSCGERQG